MKKHLSIFGLAASYSLFSCLVVLAIMGGIQIGLFYLYDCLNQPTFYDALGQIPFKWIIIIGSAIYYFLLSSALCDKGGRLNNLLLRLYVSEKGIYIWQTLYNFIMFTLFVVFQGMVFVLLAWLYKERHPGQDPLTYFFATYRHSMFHLFLPLDNLLVWSVNMIMILGLATCSAAFSFSQRHRKTSVKTLIMWSAWVNYILMMEESHLGVDIPFMMAIPALFCIGGAALTVGMMEVDDDGSA